MTVQAANVKRSQLVLARLPLLLLYDVCFIQNLSKDMEACDHEVVSHHKADTFALHIVCSPDDDKFLNCKFCISHLITLVVLAA